MLGIRINPTHAYESCMNTHTLTYSYSCMNAYAKLAHTHTQNNADTHVSRKSTQYIFIT